MSLESLNRVLGALDKQESWRARQQFQRLLACWTGVVGPAVACQTRPLTIQRGVLKVATSSAAWAQNLTFERCRILEKLNPQLPTALVDIRFSTAQWQSDRSNPSFFSAEQGTLWKEHPSLVTATTSRATPRPVKALKDPNAAFQYWSDVMQARSRSLPLCPGCQCPAPAGELQRWSVCALCIVKQW